MGLMWKLYITRKCNSRCQYCVNALRRKDWNKDLSLDQIKTIIDKLADYGIRHLTLVGGEPMVRKDINKICKHLEEKGIPFAIISNGLLWNSETANQVLDSPMLENIVLSMDGHTPELYAITRHPKAFQKVEENLKNILKRKSKPSISINTIVHKQNYYHLPEMYRYFCSLGVQSWSLLKFVPQKDLLEDNKQLSLNKEDLIKAHEILFKTLSQDKSNNKMEVEAYFSTPNIIQYYNKTYGQNMKLPDLLMGTGEDFFTLLNDGEVIPNYFAFDYPENTPSNSQNENTNILDMTISEILESPRIKKYASRKKEKKNYEHKFCHQCPHFEKLCFPRIEKTGRKQDDKLVLLCGETLKGTQEIESKRNYSMVFHKIPEVHLCLLDKDYYLTNASVKKSIRLTSLGVSIWNHIGGGGKVSEIWERNKEVFNTWSISKEKLSEFLLQLKEDRFLTARF